MPSYRYSGLDDQGRRVGGLIEAGTKGQAEAQLAADGFAVERLAIVEEGPVDFPGSVSRRDLAELVEQLAALTRSGLPLPSGLRAAGAELDSRPLRATFFDLAGQVESGRTLDEAIASKIGRFPPHVRGLVLAGARSGRLADVLGEYVRTASVGEELRRQFWATLAYPLVTLGAVVVLVGFICHLSVQAVGGLMGDLPAILLLSRPQASPGQAQLLIVLAKFVDQNGLTVLLATFGVAALAWVTARAGMGAARRRRLACRVPVLGPVLRFAALAEFCHLLAMLIEAKVPLPAALELASGAVRDADLAEACGRMGQAVGAGQPLSVAVEHWPGIPSGLGQLFRWSEIHRSLPEALRLAGEMFEARTRSQAQFARSVLGMGLLLLILWWVGFAIASLYIPMMQTIRYLSG